MKTSGLTRFLALCLAVISLSMLVSGVLGIRSAAKERRKDDAEIRDLQSKIDDYREISALLMDTETYAELSDALKEQQEKYENDTSHHRTELTTYTATNGGLEMGAEALAQAQAALLAGKSQYETGRKTLEKQAEMIQQALASFSSLIQQLNTVQGIIGTARVLSNELETLQTETENSETLMDVLLSDLETLRDLRLAGEENPSQDPAPDHPAADDAQDGQNTEGGQNPEDGQNPENTEDGAGSDAPQGPADSDEDAKQGPEAGIDAATPDLSSETEPQASVSGADGAAAAGGAQDDLTPREEENRPVSPQTGEEEEALPLAFAAVRHDAKRLAESLKVMQSTIGRIQDETALIEKDLQTVQIPASMLESLLLSVGIRADGIDGVLGEIDSRLAEYSDVIAALEPMLSQAGEDEHDPLEDRIRNLEALADRTDDDIPNAVEAETLIVEYSADSRLMEGATALIGELQPQLDSGLTEIEEQFAKIGNYTQEMGSAGDQLNQALGALDKVAEQIAEGEEALAEGEAQLNAAKDEQKKKAEELDQEKRSLDQQEADLKQLSERAEEQKTAEEREKTLRSALLSRPEIKRRSQYGQDLLSASEAWLREQTESAENNYQDRFDSGILMIVCAILALAGALTCFGGRRNIAVTILAAVLCQAFAFCAAYLLFRMGRGISWSALVTGVLATGVLASLLPSMTAQRSGAAPARPEPGWKKIERDETGRGQK